MATKGQVTLRGRFRPRALVRLVKVEHEGVLRAEGGETVAEKVVDADGCVQFTTGVEVGGRYFVVGQLDGTPLEVRCRGNEPSDDTALVQAPVQPERQKLADGRFADELVAPGAPRTAAKPEPAPKAPTRRRPAKASAAKAPAKKAAPSRAPSKSTTAKPARGPARKGK